MWIYHFIVKRARKRNFKSDITRKEMTTPTLKTCESAKKLWWYRDLIAEQFFDASVITVGCRESLEQVVCYGDGEMEMGFIVLLFQEC